MAEIRAMTNVEKRAKLVEEVCNSLEQIGGMQPGKRASDEDVEDCLDAMAFCIALLIRQHSEPDVQVLEKLYILLTTNLENWEREKG